MADRSGRDCSCQEWHPFVPADRTPRATLGPANFHGWFSKHAYWFSELSVSSELSTLLCCRHPELVFPISKPEPSLPLPHYGQLRAPGERGCWSERGTEGSVSEQLLQDWMGLREPTSSET